MAKETIRTFWDVVTPVRVAGEVCPHRPPTHAADRNIPAMNQKWHTG